MNPVDLAELLTKYGGWGVAVLLMLVVAYLHKGWQACSEARIADAKAVIEEQTRCITNSSQHIAASSLATVAATASNEQRLRAFELLAAEVREMRDDLRGLGK